MCHAKRWYGRFWGDSGIETEATLYARTDFDRAATRAADCGLRPGKSGILVGSANLSKFLVLTIFNIYINEL